MSAQCPSGLLPAPEGSLPSMPGGPVPDDARDAAAGCLRLFLEQEVVDKGKNIDEFRRPRKKQIEEAGMAALHWMLSDSVAKNLWLDLDTRKLLLAFLRNELPSRMAVERSRGKPARVPPAAVRSFLREEFRKGGFEAGIAAATERFGLQRSRVTEIAKQLKSG
jgi:hypothetical protein